MMLTDIAGLAGHASALAASILLLPAVRRLSVPRYSVLIASVFLLALVPLPSLPLAGYTRGMVGDLSLTTLLLIGLAILRPYGIVSVAKSRPQLLLVIAIVAIIFYPMTLGISLSDPYRLGYSDARFFALVLLLALVASWRQSNLIVLSLTLATLAWSQGLYESSNWWDYFIDPLVAIYALFYLAKRAVQRLHNGSDRR